MDKKTQARLAHHSRPKYPQHAITRQQPGGPFTITYGHDGVMQYMLFGRLTDHVAFATPKDVDDAIAALQAGKQKLAEHKANGGPVTTQGNDREQ